MNNINLITTNPETSAKKDSRVRIVRIIAGIVLGIVVLCSIALFLLKTRYSSQNILNQQAVVSQELDQASEKRAKLFVTEERLTAISGILKSRTPTDTILHTFLDSLPLDTRADSVSISKKSVNLVVSSPSLFSINTYVDSLLNISTTRKNIAKILLDNLTYNEGAGRYSLSLKITLL